MPERFTNVSNDDEDNNHGRVRIIQRAGKVDVGYARVAQFWTALAVTAIGGLVVAIWQSKDTKSESIDALLHQNQTIIGIMQEKQNRHESEIHDMQEHFGHVADDINNHLGKLGDDVVHLRERVVCLEHHGSCAGRVPD